jgi:ribulose-phosphate 3-epimerase
MDGHFVPNLSFGADVVAACRAHAAVPFEAHLTVENPDQWLQPFADAGCDTILVHAEACRHGFDGQAYLETMEGKVAEARRLIAQSGLQTLIEVDGGIPEATLRLNGDRAPLVTDEHHQLLDCIVPAGRDHGTLQIDQSSPWRG